jgi:prophage maintenance system killer protein
MDKKQIVIYTAKDGSAELMVQIEQETIWLTQKQMSDLFNKDVRTVNEHIKNLFTEGELEKDSVIRKFRITATDGKNYNVEHYNLDVIISVGYRVKSIEGTRFRQWATRVLKNYTIQGYAINQKRLEQKGYIELEQTVDLVSKAVRSKQLQASEAQGLLHVIADYMQTWILLQAYDDGSLKQAKSKRPIYEIELAQAQTAVDKLKQELINKKEASQLFATERGHGLSAIIGSINQSFGGKDVYATIAAKAAHLLYFVVKDHPFADGNKRSGAMLFIWYLAKNKMLSSKLNGQTLAAITLLVAESNPKQKDVMVNLITNLIN